MATCVFLCQKLSFGHTFLVILAFISLVHVNIDERCEIEVSRGDSLMGQTTLSSLTSRNRVKSRRCLFLYRLQPISPQKTKTKKGVATCYRVPHCLTSSEALSTFRRLPKPYILVAFLRKTRPSLLNTSMLLWLLQKLNKQANDLVFQFKCLTSNTY